MSRSTFFTTLLLLAAAWASAQNAAIPSSYGNLRYDSLGIVIGKATDGSEIVLQSKEPKFTLQGAVPKVNGDADGLRLRFSAEGLFKGSITYGLIPYGQHTYPTAVLRFTASIDSTGAAFLANFPDRTN